MSLRSKPLYSFVESIYQLLLMPAARRASRWLHFCRFAPTNRYTVFRVLKSILHLRQQGSPRKPGSPLDLKILTLSLYSKSQNSLLCSAKQNLTTDKLGPACF